MGQPSATALLRLTDHSGAAFRKFRPRRGIDPRPAGLPSMACAMRKSIRARSIT